jgi:hypothetical protein
MTVEIVLQNFRSTVAALVLLLSMTGIAAAQKKPTIKLGYAKCAHCTPLTLVPC